MNEFGFNDDRNEKIEFIKKLGIIVLVFIIVFLVVRGCNNYLTNKIREDTNKDKLAKIENETKEEIELNKPFSYYNITTNAQLHSFLRLIGKNLAPKSLSKYIDYENQTGFSINGYTWYAYDNLYEILNMLNVIAYENLVKLIIKNEVDYDEAPLTNQFKLKLNNENSVLNKHDFRNYPWQIKHFYLNKRSFVITKYNGEAQDEYYFDFVLDEEGYLDDIILDHIEPIYDEYGAYIPKKDSKLMNNEEDIKLIISQIILSEDQYVFDGDEGYYYWKDPQSRYNRFQEFGFTDKFKEYYNALDGKGLIDDELSEYDDIKVENIDIEKRNAEVKLELSELNVIKYYDISWTIDNEYRMDTIEVKFNREELE